MKSALLLALLIGQQTPATAPSETVVYTNVELGLTFNHPKTWTVETKKNRSKIIIPLENSTETAALEIYSALFNSEIEIWQAGQKDINDQMKREVLQQWQEEILGVPLLLTKSQAVEKGVSMVTVSGLMYSATPRKFVYRLIAPSSEFDKADYAFRTALQSIRTVDGTMPKPEDPNRKLRPVDLEPITNSKRTVWKVAKRDPATYVKGSVTAEAEAGGKKLLLRAPEGWTIEKNEAGAYLLKHPSLTGVATVTIASTLDSESPGRALMKASGRSLDSFGKVVKRLEKPSFEASSGSTVGYVYRTGVGEGKDLSSFDSTGLFGEAYWTLVWSGGPLEKDYQTLMALIDVLSVELVP